MATAGLAGLVLSGCEPQLPERPYPTDKQNINVVVGNNRWRFHNHDKNTNTYEVVEQIVYGDNEVRTVYHAPGFREIAAEYNAAFRIREMTPEMQNAFNQLGTQLVSFQDTANLDAYQLRLDRYNASKNEGNTK